MPSGLSTSCCALLMFVSKPGEAAHHLVGRRLVHAALDVVAGVDAGDEARRAAAAGGAAARPGRPRRSGRGSRSRGGRARRTCVSNLPRNSRISVIELSCGASTTRDPVAQRLGSARSGCPSRSAARPRGEARPRPGMATMAMSSISASAASPVAACSASSGSALGSREVARARRSTPSPPPVRSGVEFGEARAGRRAGRPAVGSTPAEVRVEPDQRQRRRPGPRPAGRGRSTAAGARSSSEPGVDVESLGAPPDGDGDVQVRTSPHRCRQRRTVLPARRGSPGVPSGARATICTFAR